MITIYEYVLYTILRFPGITAEALLMLHDRAATVYGAIRKGLKQNHIAQHRLKHGRHITNYLVLTPDGILYLQAEMRERGLSDSSSAPFYEEGFPSTWSWIQYMKVTQDAKLNFRTSGVSTEIMLRFCGISAANLFFDLVGASTANTLLPKREKLTSPYCEAVRDAVQSCNDREGSNTNYHYGELGFESAVTVKDRLAKVSAPELARAGRYTGVLRTDHAIYTVYYGSKDGMSWAPLARKRDLDAMEIYQDKFKPSSSDEQRGCLGIMLVQNDKMFADLLLDCAKKNRDRKGLIKYRFGEGFDSFVVFPATRDGWQLAQRYVLLPADNAIQIITSRILKKVFPGAKRQSAYWIELKGSSRPVYQLIFMNCSTIFTIMKNNQKNSFDIICLDWEITYYARIFEVERVNEHFKIDGQEVMWATVKNKPEITSLFLFQPLLSRTNTNRKQTNVSDKEKEKILAKIIKENSFGKS